MLCVKWNVSIVFSIFTFVILILCRKQAINAITSQSPDYDIEVQSKIFSDPLGQSTLKSRVMFAVKSPAQYMYLEACCKSRKWSVKMVQNFTMLTSVADVVDPNLRPGVFSSILIQIRSPNGISIDITVMRDKVKVWRLPSSELCRE